MKKLFILLFSILISFNSYGETESDYYSNGQIKTEATYKDGKLDGKSHMWHENGQKWEEGNYKDDKEDGKWTGWYANGQKLYEGNFKDGEYDGIWTEWDENGHIKAKATFLNGRCISGDCDSFYQNEFFLVNFIKRLFSWI